MVIYKRKYLRTGSDFFHISSRLLPRHDNVFSIIISFHVMLYCFVVNTIGVSVPGALETTDSPSS